MVRHEYQARTAQLYLRDYAKEQVAEVEALLARYAPTEKGQP